MSTNEGPEVAATSPKDAPREIDEPATGPEAGLPSAADEDDVEGHYFAPNAMVSRSTTQTRERDVQRNLQQHDLKKEARRPFFKKG